MAVDPQAGKDEATLLRKAVGGLPADVRDFLFEGAPAVEPEDMKTVLAIAAKIATLTPDQRLEYKARTSAVAADWQAYGKSIGRFLAELAERKTEDAKRSGMET